MFKQNYELYEIFKKANHLDMFEVAGCGVPEFVGMRLFVYRDSETLCLVQGSPEDYMDSYGEIDWDTVDEENLFTIYGFLGTAEYAFIGNYEVMGGIN